VPVLAGMAHSGHYVGMTIASCIEAALNEAGYEIVRKPKPDYWPPGGCSA
jgi:hypothetical protein